MSGQGSSAIPPGALAGLKVIDMASLYAAPLAATIMADFGADVLKIEPPKAICSATARCGRSSRAGSAVLRWTCVRARELPG